MEPSNHILLIISLSLSSLLSSFSADAICVPRNSSHISPSPSPFLAPPHISPSPFSPVDPAIKKVCDATDNPLLCISSIVPYLHGNTDPLSILEMAIKACANHTELALAEATRIATDHSTSPIMSSYLETCQENYSDAIDNLKNAADAMATRDVGTMNSMLSAALTDFNTCEDGFSEVPGVDSPMAEIDDTLSKMASNCLAIVSLIH